MAYKQISDEAALALNGTTDPDTGFQYPVILQDRWAEGYFRSLNRFGQITPQDLAVLGIEGNPDAVGVLPGVCTIGGVVLEYAGSAGEPVIDAIADNDTTLIWAFDNAGVLDFASATEATGWPGTAHIKLAKVTMAAGVITELKDMRGAAMLSG